MEKIGIIVEYNPLHNGHLLHFNKIKEKYPDSFIIAVMSSSITSRGDLSIIDKFKKTKQALKMGIDLVIELPFVLACERADIFANNAVKILNLVGVDKIICGSENNNINIYENYYQEFKENDFINFTPNDNLGFFYYKAIKDNNYDLSLELIKREENDKIISSTKIRENLDNMNDYIPSFTINDYDNIIHYEKIFNYLKYKILSSSLLDLKNIFLVDEGIEYKLKDIYKFDNIVDYIDYLQSKNYKKTRVKRMLIYILFDIKKEIVNKIYDNDINFIRVLGYNNNGKEYLNKIKKNITIYTNIKENINDILDIEINVSKIIDTIFNLNLLKNEQNKPIE
jgi:predicted nucleotidyltransferase